MSHGWLGLVVFPVIAFLLSSGKKEVDGRFCLMSLILLIAMGYLIHKTPYVKEAFLSLSHGIQQIKVATLEGTKFIFGYLGGGPCPFETTDPGACFIFAFQALPMIIVISALSMLLFHWGVIQAMVKGFSWALRKTLNIGGALGVCSASKAFLGQTDALLLIRPYVQRLTQSELFTVMTLGMATTSATAMPIYADLLVGHIDQPLGHILAASFMGIPSALLIARIMMPEKQRATEGDLAAPYEFNGSIDALSRGTQDGLHLFLSLAAILIVALAVVKLFNMIMGVFPPVMGAPLTLERISGWIMAPITWVMGVPWDEAMKAGGLLGTKTIMNEIVAFIQLGKTQGLSPSSTLIMVYGLCGFANLSSIGIQIASIGTLVPQRRKDVIQLAPRALMAGTLASCLSASVIGLIFALG